METKFSIEKDILDVRDIIERVESLEDELLTAFNEQQVIEGHDTETDDPMDSAFQQWCKVTVHEDAGEYLFLCKVLDELSGNGGDELWRGEWFPVTLINDSYFVDAMRERVDYSPVQIGKLTYWYR